MDKILTEAFDKLKAIEESEDPFCIGELTENEEDAEEEIVEEVDEEVVEGNEEVPREHETDPSSYSLEDESGNEYVIHFQQDGAKERAFIEENGIPIASFTVGGAGAMDVRIQKPDAVINALAFALMQTGY